MTELQLRDWFSYQPGNEAQIASCVALRTAAYEYAKAVHRHLPDGPDQTRTLRAIKGSLHDAIGGVVAPYPR